MNYNTSTMEIYSTICTNQLKKQFGLNQVSAMVDTKVCNGSYGKEKRNKTWVEEKGSIKEVLRRLVHCMPCVLHVGFKDEPKKFSKINTFQ